MQRGFCAGHGSTRRHDETSRWLSSQAAPPLRRALSHRASLGSDAPRATSAAQRGPARSRNPRFRRLLCGRCWAAAAMRCTCVRPVSPSFDLCIDPCGCARVSRVAVAPSCSCPEFNDWSFCVADPRRGLRRTRKPPPPPKRRRTLLSSGPRCQAGQSNAATARVALRQEAAGIRGKLRAAWFWEVGEGSLRMCPCRPYCRLRCRYRRAPSAWTGDRRLSLPPASPPPHVSCLVEA